MGCPADSGPGSHAAGEQGSVVTLLFDAGQRYSRTYCDDHSLAANGLDVTPYLATLATFRPVASGWSRPDDAGGRCVRSRPATVDTARPRVACRCVGTTTARWRLPVGRRYGSWGCSPIQTMRRSRRRHVRRCYTAGGARRQWWPRRREGAGRSTTPPSRPRQTIAGRTRKQERRAACVDLEVRHVRLLGHHDGRLEITEHSTLVDEVSALIDEFEPDVVVTFGSYGGRSPRPYGHQRRDHRCLRWWRDLSAGVAALPRLLPPTQRAVVERLACWLASQDIGKHPPLDFVHALLLLVEQTSTMGFVQDHSEVR